MGAKPLLSLMMGTRQLGDALAVQEPWPVTLGDCTEVLEGGNRSNAETAQMRKLLKCGNRSNAGTAQLRELLNGGNCSTAGTAQMRKPLKCGNRSNAETAQRRVEKSVCALDR